MVSCCIALQYCQSECHTAITVQALNKCNISSQWKWYCDVYKLLRNKAACNVPTFLVETILCTFFVCEELHTNITTQLA